VETLGRKRIDIVAEGNYPVKRNTKVADVAVYQNDGTEKITPSRFVERAAAKAGDWAEEINAASGQTLEGDPAALDALGGQVAKAIEDMCDRIDTGRLKKSFKGEVKEK